VTPARQASSASGYTGGTPPPGSVPGVYKVGNGVTPPHLIHIVDPGYTDEARNAKYGAACVVGLIVDTNGNPQNVHIVRPVGMGLDQKAIEAVRQYRFTPAMYQGHPVPVGINVEVNFRIRQ
ncbi:MAG TPA: energy transducer TonB, partial [Acidobacteriaceae bacterium]|nr:energy transducer TonB [Acidobacteriaceae bacterium]